VGDILAPRNDLAEAVPHYREALRIFQAIAPRMGQDLAAQFEMVNAYEALGDALGNPGLVNLGDAQGAKDAYEEARSIEEAVAAAHPDNLRSRRGVGLMEWKIGDVEMGLGNVDEGLRRYQSAVQAFERLLARDPLNPTTRLFLGLATGKVGSAFEAAGRTQAALAQYQKSQRYPARLDGGRSAKRTEQEQLRAKPAKPGESVAQDRRPRWRAGSLP